MSSGVINFLLISLISVGLYALLGGVCRMAEHKKKFKAMAIQLVAGSLLLIIGMSASELTREYRRALVAQELAQEKAQAAEKPLDAAATE